MSPSEPSSLSTPSPVHRGWLVANGLMVAVMVFGLVFHMTSSWDGWNRIPDHIWDLIAMPVLLSGPIGLVFCSMAFSSVKRGVERPVLRRIFVGLNLVGIAIGLASLVPCFILFMLSFYRCC
ncbi:hypothetical protein [Roseimicrobium sp. ORNL1]|uniref:hypothetical protein n=1 Tax=Roseimicrobium sp. ORNL1 TaxID=2711231 RepID=UPI0013E1FDB0|nr:hypothetical protein [Roseimicrobium sp. ORNL1]QIF04903.1 hypothetical protein G5S37_26445 [Roseimicrobium sp. ORNL1]